MTLRWGVDSGHDLLINDYSCLYGDLLLDCEYAFG